MPVRGTVSQPITPEILSLLPPSKRNLTTEKRNGVFYTPDSFSRLLADWAIRKPTDTVLEPSFGGCGFLEATKARLIALGATLPENQLFGCDIEDRAFASLESSFGRKPDEQHFKQKDFLTVAPSDFAISAVEVVIGNPPYVSWHNMLPAQRLTALAVKTPSGVRLDRKGSLWSFFVAHSLHFLQQGGRMAWILPGSFIHADYAAPFRKALTGLFSRCIAILLEERIFLTTGTDESSVVLLCEGYDEKPTQAMRFAAAKNVEKLESIVGQWAAGKSVGVEWQSQVNKLLAPSTAVEVYERLLTTSCVKRLGDLIKIRIGLVTGDNGFFVLKPSEAKEHELPAEVLRPIVARLAHIRGLQVTNEDLDELLEQNARSLLLNTSIYQVGEEPSQLGAYLGRYDKGLIEQNRTFAKHKPWHRVAQEAVPDGFFSCMNWYGPMLVLNPARTTCTNTVYRVQFLDELFATGASKQLVAICLQSTFSQFSAEVVGRSYGSGALKLEPSEVARIVLLLPPAETEISRFFNQIDHHLRAIEVDKARQVADQLLIEQGLLTATDVSELEHGLLTLRALRQGARRPPTQ